MIIHWIRQFSVVVEDEPPSLPSLGPVDWVGEVPVRGHKQVTTFWYLSAGFVQLDGWGWMVLLEAKTVWALALVENVWSKLPALHVSHGCGYLFMSGERWDGPRPLHYWHYPASTNLSPHSRGQASCERSAARPGPVWPACPAQWPDWTLSAITGHSLPATASHTASHHQSQWKVVIQRTGLGRVTFPVASRTTPARPDISQPEKSLWQLSPLNSSTNRLEPRQSPGQTCWPQPSQLSTCRLKLRAPSVIRPIIIKTIRSAVIYHKVSLEEILRPRYPTCLLRSATTHYSPAYYLCVIKIIEAKYDFQTAATTTTTLEMSRLLNTQNWSISWWHS